MRHRFVEVSYRSVEKDGKRWVEVLFGCLCERLTYVAEGVDLREARRAARTLVKAHAFLAEQEAA